MSRQEGQTVYIALNDCKLAEDISSQITCFGFQAHTFTTTTPLAEAIHIKQPHFIIIDVGFCQGELHGVELMQTIQQNLTRPVPTVFLSERDDLATRLACVRAQGRAFLAMPVDVSLLLEKLEHLTTHIQHDAYRILIVEDSRAQAYFIATTLHNAGMQTAVVHDPLQLTQVLVEFRPELILMDIYLPKCTGLELAYTIRQQDAYVSVPLVFLSSEKDLSRQLKALMLGGDDFLTKPITPEHLVSAIHSRAARSRVLRSYMIRDSLTGLLNHTHLLEQLDIEVSRAARDNCCLTFVMIDMDHFKRVNDTYGHPVGDRVIKSLSHLLQQRLRKTDIIGRYGGEEFALILPNTDMAQALSIIEEVRLSFRALRHFFNKQSFHVSLSAGIACYQSGYNAKSLSEAADKALYHAKRSGRNQVKAYQVEKTDTQANDLVTA